MDNKFSAIDADIINKINESYPKGRTREATEYEIE